MHSQKDCSDEQLLLMLNSDEAEADRFEGLLQHVASCTACQGRLDQLAASTSHWEIASQVLSGFSSNDAFRSTFGPLATRPQTTEDRPIAWTESMARQLLTPASHPEMLGRIGRYEVERLIGSGGMGIVFKAIDTELNRPVAIKILAPYLAGSGAARQRFAREAKAAAAVVHEHVVPIHNVETDGQSPFLVMRYVAGESLQARIDREGSMDIFQVLRIAKQIASGLAAAHSHGLVHRDIKPSNVLVESGVERSLITDFGLARAADDASLTNTGYHPGTPQFMSPEQARGDAIDSRSDLFSLGSVIYTMCVGRPPFRAETSYGILRRITDTQPRPIQEINPVMPNWMCGIIAKLMSKSPDDRFQSADDVVAILELCLAHVQHPSMNALPAEVAQFDDSAKRKRWKPLWLVGSALFIGVSLFALSGQLPTGFGLVSPDLSEEPASHAQANTTGGQRSASQLGNPQANSNSQPPATSPNLKSPSAPNSQAVRGPRKPPPIEPADRIRQALAERTEVDLQNATLQDAITQVLSQSGLRANVLAELFESESIDLAATISLRAQGPTYSLLRRICEPYKASYIVRETNIEIVPTEFARQNPTLRYYDLAFVLPDSTHTQSVITTIQQQFANGQWIGNGGACSISLIDSVLVIRATESTHLEIEGLLSQLVSNPSVSNSK